MKTEPSIELLKHVRDYVSTAFKNRIYPLGSLPYKHGEQCLQVALATLNGLIMGDASTRKDEAVHNGGSPTIGGSPSEIWDNAQSMAFNLAVDLGDKLFDMIKNPGGAGGLISWDRYEVSQTIESVILKALSPYLRTTEPVSGGDWLDKKAAMADAQKVCDLTHRINGLYNEIDCRIEHGAEGNGHLDYVHKQLKHILEVANAR